MKPTEEPTHNDCYANEEWRSVIGWPHYSVSNLGRVKSHNYWRRGVERVLSPRQAGHGYYGITLCDAGRQLDAKIHVLVAEAFIGPRPSGMWVNHKDSVRSNNRAENLEWVTPSENNLHAYRTGNKKPSAAMGSNHPRSKLNEEVAQEIRSRYQAEKIGMARLAKQYGVTKVVVRNILKGVSYRGSMDSPIVPVASRKTNGADNPSAKITLPQAKAVEVMIKGGDRLVDISAKLGIGLWAIQEIKHGRHWSCRSNDNANK